MALLLVDWWNREIENPYPMVVPWITRAALDRDRSGIVGTGIHVLPDVDIQVP